MVGVWIAYSDSSSFKMLVETNNFFTAYEYSYFDCTTNARIRLSFWGVL